MSFCGKIYGGGLKLHPPSILVNINPRAEISPDWLTHFCVSTLHIGPFILLSTLAFASSQ